jgi:hypothetical protein
MDADSAGQKGRFLRASCSHRPVAPAVRKGASWLHCLYLRSSASICGSNCIVTAKMEEIRSAKAKFGWKIAPALKKREFP